MSVICAVFCYSYSYDLSHTLQYNLAPCGELKPCDAEGVHHCRVAEHSSASQRTTCHEGEVEDASKSIGGFSSITSSSDSADSTGEQTPSKTAEGQLMIPV